MSLRPIAPTPAATGPAGEPPGRLHTDDANAGAAPTGPSALERARAWATDEWSTVALAAHGAGSTPGLVAKAWDDAAADNRDIANSINSLRREWSRLPADGRVAAVQRFTSMAKHLPNGAALARQLSALASSPAANRSRALPHELAATLKKSARAFTKVAAAQQAHGTNGTVRLSRALATSFGDASGAGEALGRLVPALAHVPIAGAVIAAAASVDDVHAHHVEPATAAVANAGSLVAGTAAGEAVTSAVAGAVVGGAAEAGAGVVAVAAAPVAAVAAGVVAAVGTGYIAYKIAESRGGQDIIGGTVHGDPGRIERGAAEAAADVGRVGARARALAHRLL